MVKTKAADFVREQTAEASMENYGRHGSLRQKTKRPISGSNLIRLLYLFSIANL